jgi:hypothetical protein
MTTAITLTDRYIAALQQQLPLRPLRRRKDIEVELRALIADAIEDRIEAGESPSDAEFEAIAELGNPARLAASYSDRPQSLLGPELYPDYRRLLRIVLTTIVPGVAVMLIAAQLLAGLEWLDLLGTTVVIVATLTMHLLFWITVIFATVERIPRVRAKTLVAWQPAALPETPDGREGFGETVGGLAFVVGFIALLVVSPTLTSATDAAGNSIGVISPLLAQSWPIFVAIVVVAAGFGLATEYLGWTTRLAVVNAILTVFGMSLLVWLVASNNLVNPEFFESIGWSSDAPATIGWILVGLAVLNGIRSIVSGFVSAARRARASR